MRNKVCSKGEYMDSVKKGVAPAKINIGNDLTIHQVTNAYKEWEHVKHAKELEIDASKVNNIDTAGLQLLAYLIKFVVKNNGNITWVQPTSYLLDQTKLAGMAKLLLIQGESK